MSPQGAKPWYTKAMRETTATAEFETHPKTGLPVLPVAAFERGDLVTESIMSDGYPGVVVHATPKTAYVRRVSFVGNFSADDAPGYNGYGDSGTIAVDPESVEEALAAGKAGAHKYVLHVYPAARYGSLNERDTYGETFHRAAWREPNGGSMRLSKGASYRQDPHR